MGTSPLSIVRLSDADLDMAWTTVCSSAHSGAISGSDVAQSRRPRISKRRCSWPVPAEVAYPSISLDQRLETERRYSYGLLWSDVFFLKGGRTERGGVQG